MNWTEIIREMEQNHYTFGMAFREIRERQGISIREIARRVTKTPPYIWDIEKGNNRPPARLLLEELLTALELQDEITVTSFLFDLAAKERGGFPEDIAEYIMKNEALRTLIRRLQKEEKSEQLWRDCVEFISSSENC